MARCGCDASVLDSSLRRADADITMTDMREPFWSDTLMEMQQRFSSRTQTVLVCVQPAFKIAGTRNLAPAELNKS